MNAQRVNIFNETYGNHVVFCIASTFPVPVLPSRDRLLQQNLADKAGLKTTGTYSLFNSSTLYTSPPPAPPIYMPDAKQRDTPVFSAIAKASSTV